jgi:hypothetical protein
MGYRQHQRNLRRKAKRRKESREDLGEVLVPCRGSVRSEEIVAFARVDAQDGWVLKYDWFLSRDGYATRMDGRRRVTLHAAVMRAHHGCGLEVDHIDRDRLNDRLSNLRFATRAEQNTNRSLGSERGLAA